MYEKIITLLISFLFIICCIFTNNKAFSRIDYKKKTFFQWALGIDYNYLLVYKEPHIQMIFMPGFKILWGELNLHLPITWNRYKEVVLTDYKSRQGQLGKIERVFIEDPKKIFMLYMGEEENINIGYGLIVERYRNNLAQPYIKRTGLLSKIDLPYFNVRTMVSDFSTYSIVGGRAAIKPVALTNYNFFDIKNFEIGISYFKDENIYRVDTIEFRLKEKKIIPLKTKGPKVVEYGYDMALPLKLTDWFIFGPYYEYAKIDTKGDGQTIGLMGKLWPKGMNLSYLVGFRSFTERFLPGYFNSMYEISRFNKYSELDYAPAATSKYIEIKWPVVNDKIFINYSIESMYKEFHHTLEILLLRAVPNIDIRILYDNYRTTADDLGRFQMLFFTKDDWTIVSAGLSYHMNKYASFGFHWYKGFASRFNDTLQPNKQTFYWTTIETNVRF